MPRWRRDSVDVAKIVFHQGRQSARRQTLRGFADPASKFIPDLRDLRCLEVLVNLYLNLGASGNRLRGHLVQIGQLLQRRFDEIGDFLLDFQR